MKNLIEFQRGNKLPGTSWEALGQSGLNQLQVLEFDPVG